MGGYILLAAGLAFAAGVQPGPLQAFLFSRVVMHGWRRTLPAALAPVISDGPIILLVLLLLARIPPELQRVLQAAGGGLLLLVAGTTLKGLRSHSATEEERELPRTLPQAVLVNLLNPAPYIGWSLVMGPAAVKAWREAPANAVAFISSFYVTLVLTLAMTIVVFGTAGYLAAGRKRVLGMVSVLVLACLGVYQIVGAVH